MNGQRTCVPTVGTGYILPEKPSFVCSYFIDTCVAMCACTHTVHSTCVPGTNSSNYYTKIYISSKVIIYFFSMFKRYHGTWYYNMCVQICFHFSHFRNRVT